MKLFIKKNSIVIAYFLICSFLIIKAELDCIGARDWGIYFCSVIEYTFLKWLLMPTIFLIDYSAIYNYLYEITIHAEFYLLVITFLLNTLLIFFVVQIINNTIARKGAKK